MQAYQSDIVDGRGLDLFSLMAAALSPAPAESTESTRGEDRCEAGSSHEINQRGWFERLDEWLWDMHQRDIEAYLAQSSDVCDLERRQRALERNAPYPYC